MKRSERQPAGPRERDGCLTRAVVASFLLLFSVFPLELDAQLRREAPVQPVAGVTGGDLLLGLGLSYAVDGTHPLSGFSGNLLSVPEVTVGYGLGDRAMIELRMPVVQRLAIHERSEPSIPLDPGTDDDVTVDAGDVRITTSFAPFGNAMGFSAGGLVSVQLPNSDEKLGIGTNTTDVTAGLLGSWGAESWRGTGTLGLAILQAPVDEFEQNDLISYGFDLLVRASRRVRLSLGLSGLATIRRTTWLGTESRGAAAVGAEWSAGRWILDASVVRGYVGNTADWRLAAGVAWSRSSGGGT